VGWPASRASLLARQVGVSFEKESERPLPGLADPNPSRHPDPLSFSRLAHEEAKGRVRKAMAIHSAIDGESCGKARGAIREMRTRSPPFAHRGKAQFRLEGADQNGLRISPVAAGKQRQALG
jgi:hypothetical protein